MKKASPPNAYCMIPFIQRTKKAKLIYTEVRTVGAGEGCGDRKGPRGCKSLARALATQRCSPGENASSCAAHLQVLRFAVCTLWFNKMYV